MRNFMLWLLISISPLSAGVTTIVNLLASQSSFTMTMPLSNGTSLTYPSPWISYAVFYLLLSTDLDRLSVRAVKRVEK